MLLEKLRSTDVREDILQMFYTATVSSISTFGMIRWGRGGGCIQTRQAQTRQERPGGLVGRRPESTDTAYHRLVTNKQDNSG